MRGILGANPRKRELQAVQLWAAAVAEGKKSALYR